MLSAAAQVGADGKLIHPGASGYLADGTVGVVVEDDDDPLLRSESLQRIEELLVGVWIVKRALGQRPAGKARLALEVAGRNAKGGSPDPVAHVPNLSPAAQRLGEGFGDGIGRDVLVASEGKQRSPQAIAVLSVHRLKVACRGYGPRHRRHYAPTGADGLQKVTVRRFEPSDIV